MTPYIGRLMQAHIQLMQDPDLNLNLKPNLAVTVGRLCLTNTAQVRTRSNLSRCSFRFISEH